MTTILSNFLIMKLRRERKRLIATNPLIHYDARSLTRLGLVALSPTVETILNYVLIYAGIMRGFARIIEISRLK